MEIKNLNAQELAELLMDNISSGTSKSNVIDILIKWKSDLQHHKDTTIGLWATDRIDLVDDPKKVMFQIQ